ncbi:MAG TPA: ABC transporter permease, partial [bacterium]|nr:ABC transporter permease [bacterium]
LAVQAPVVGLLIAMVFGGVDRITAEAVPTREMLLEGVLFMLVLSALWFGTNNAAREISKERSVYKRERMVFLKLGPYVLSKFAVLAVLCFLQCSAMLLIVRGFLRLPGDFAQILQILMVLFLTALVGTAMGLLISALVRTSNVAVGLVPIVLIPQIIFGGLVRPPEDMGPVSRAVSRVMVAYWAYSAVREFSVGLPEKGDVHDLNLEEPGVVGIGSSPRDIISAVKERFGLTRAPPTDENLKRNSFIIFSFIPAFVLLSVIALKLKEREGFATR